MEDIVTRQLDITGFHLMSTRTVVGVRGCEEERGEKNIR